VARGVVPLQQGFLYQAYYFWLEAARLFESHSKVSLVGYEINGAKAFDDVHVQYNEPRRCGRGAKIEKDFFQLKFHVDHSGSVGYLDLIDPKFIGAKKVSFLQRLHELCKSNVDFAKNSCFHLYTPWVVNPNDPLSKIVNTDDGAIRIEKLQSAGGPKSELGKVKKAWMNHLQLISEDELYSTLIPLRIQQGPSLARLKESLNERLLHVGLTPIDFSKSSDPYPGLIFRLCKEGRSQFTKEQLLEELQRDGLISAFHKRAAHTAKQMAIRSFFRSYEHLEDVSELILSLELYFDGRFIKDPNMWNRELKAEISDFAKLNLVRNNSPLDLHLDVHSSLAFATGSLISPKEAIDIAPVQKLRGQDLVWRVSNQPAPASKLTATPLSCGGGLEIAVVLNITRSTTEEVKQFVAKSLQNVGVIYILEPETGVSQSAIKDADHAWAIAEQVSEHLRELRSKLNLNLPIHFFNSAPNSLLFFVGRLSAPAGHIFLYEYDFEKKRHGTYDVSVILPWK
jgi:hypothetical protein